MPDGSCVAAASLERCVAQDGAYTLGAGCDETECRQPPVSGACCADGECFVTVLDECDAADGDFNAELSCADVDYCRELEPTGACCLGEECLDGVTQLVCERRGGSWSDGLTCDEVNCGGGACCLLDGSCVAAAGLERCVAQDGAYSLGAGCDGTECRQPSVSGA